VTEIEAETTIDAPSEVVFGLLNTPEECVRAGPSQRFREVTPIENGGHEYEYTFRMAGVSLTGTVRTVQHDPPRRLLNEYAGDIDATIAFVLTPENGGTRFRATATYELPHRAIEIVADPIVRRYNRRELDGFVENVREFVETAECNDATYRTGEVTWTPEPEPGVG
jgi:uncharacterized protein YndB with AHSA1/START domain